MRHLTPLPSRTEAPAPAAGRTEPPVPPQVTVLVAPGTAVAGGAAPLVGYLLLAPAGTRLSELGELLASAPVPRAAQPGSPARPGEAGVVVDAGERTALVDGRQLTLTYLEFELLSHLVRHPHQVWTREQLTRTIWGHGPVGDQRTVDAHVARLRRKLGPAHRERIVTVRRAGYKYAP